MASLATLTAKVEMKANNLQVTVDSINKKLDSLHKTAKKTQKSMAATAKAAVAAVAVYVVEKFISAVRWLSHIAKAFLEPIASANRFARSIGDAVGPVLELRSALKQTGGSAETMDAALVDVGTAIAGLKYDRATQDVFRRMGLDFATFKNLKPSEAFIKIAEAISKIPDPQKRAALAVQLFKEKAVELLPLLNQGAAGIEKLREQARKMGQTATEDQANAAELLNQKWNNVLDTLEGIGKQLAVGIAPAVLAILEDLGLWGDSIGSVTESLSGVTRTFVSLYVFARDFWDIMLLGAKAWDWIFLKSLEGAVKWLRDVAKEMGKLPGKIGEKAREAADKLNGLAAKINGKALDKKFDMQDIKKRIDERSTDKMMEEIEKHAKRIREGVKKAKDAAAQPFANFNKDLFGPEAKSAFEAAMTPLEKFQQEMDKLQTMLDAGAISWETFGRAGAKALNELSDAIGDKEFKFAGVAKAGTHEAYTARIRNEAMSERNRESPEKRVERLQEQSLIVQKQQAAYLEKIADALKNRRPVAIGK